MSSDPALLRSEDREQLLALCVAQSFPKGARLLHEGEEAPGLFFVEQGRVNVSKRDMGGHEQTITELSAPAVIGEMELVTGGGCAASVIAMEPVEARLLPRATFDGLLDRGDPLAVRLLRGVARALAHKLVGLDEFYVDMAIWRT